MSGTKPSPLDVHTTDVSSDPQTVVTESDNQPISQKKGSDPPESFNDMPPPSQTENKKQYHQEIKRSDGSFTKKFIYWSVVVAAVAILGWYLYSAHSEVVALRSEVKTLQVWMAVKMEKLQDKTISKMDELHTKVAKIIKDSSTKEIKLLKNIESNTKL